MPAKGNRNSGIAKPKSRIGGVFILDYRGANRRQIVALGSHQPATGGRYQHMDGSRRHHTTQGTTGKQPQNPMPPLRTASAYQQAAATTKQLTTAHQQTRAGSSNTERPAVCCARAGSLQRCDTQQQSCRAPTRVLSLTAHTCRRAHNSTHSNRPGLAWETVYTGRTVRLQEQVQLQQLSWPFMTHKGR